MTYFAFRKEPGGHLSGVTQYDDGVYFGNALRPVHGVIAYRDSAMVRHGRGTIAGCGTLPGQIRAGRCDGMRLAGANMRGLELTGRSRYRLSLVKHQRSLTMFLLTRAS